MGFAVEWMDPLLRLLLVGCRTGSFLLMTPLFRRLPIPAPASTAMILLTSLAFAAAGLGPAAGSVEAGWHLAGAVVVEVAIGFAMGLVTLLVFEGFRLAGQLIGLTMGLAAATLLDPNENSQLSVVAMAYGLLSGVLFILMDGHHVLLRTLAASYVLAPVGGAQFPAGAGQSLITLLAVTFTLALRVAAPVMAALLITDVIAAILGRTIPQMPVFFVVLPVKMMLGYGLTILTLPLLATLLENAVLGLERDILLMVRGM